MAGWELVTACAGNPAGGGSWVLRRQGSQVQSCHDAVNPARFPEIWNSGTGLQLGADPVGHSAAVVGIGEGMERNGSGIRNVQRHLPAVGTNSD